MRRLRRALEDANPVKLAVGAALIVLGAVVLIPLLSTYDLPLWAEQPPTVLDQVGRKGERLGGPQVFIDAPGVPKEIFVGVDLGSIGPAGSSTSSTAP